MISEKIVVIDDDPRIIKSVKLGLKEFEIIGFTDAREGLAFLKKPNTVSMVLLDVRMPDIDGVSVLQEIKEKRKNIIVVMMTAYGTKEVILQSLRGRADEFVEKPFLVRELKEKLTALFHAKAYPQNARKDKDDQIERMKRHIDRNADQASLKSIAEEMCLSPRYLSRLFSGKSRMNYRKYKLKVKIDKAFELLINTHRTVSEISRDLGYQSPATFMRMFKAVTNETPSEFRRRYVKADKK